MSTLNKIILATLGLLMLFTMGFISSATASTLTVTKVTFPLGTPFEYEMSGGYFGDTSAVVPETYGGQIILDTAEYGKISTWCVDFSHVIVDDKYTYTTGFLTTDNTGSNIAGSNLLNTNQIHDVMALAVYGNQLMATLPEGNNRRIQAAQIQAAIWSIIYNATVTATGAPLDGFTSAMFTSGVQSLKDMAPLLSNVNAVALYNLGLDGTILSQVLITSSLPVPTTLILLGIGFVGARIRKRKYM